MLANDLETPFELQELFFSRTDIKGVIQAGNSVFRRISGYDWPELLGRPHNLVRHPDMPRGVFFLFWKTVLAGHPIAAYVKNRSKDGRYYWVFALALPINDAIVSVRLKPSSPTFEIVKEAYKNLLKAEQTQKLSPAGSCEILEQTIASLGFADYQAFMVKALMDELSERQKNLQREPIPILKRFQEILSIGAEVSVQYQQIFKSFKASALLPLNLSIQASKLEVGADSLAVVASKYSEITKEIEAEFSTFKNTIDRIAISIGKCQYFICSEVLQQEVLTVFKNETEAGPVDLKHEMELLIKINEDGNISMGRELRSITYEFSRLVDECEKMRTKATALEIIRLMGKIEISRIDKNEQELGHLIQQLLNFKTYLMSELEKTSNMGSKMKALSQRILNDLSIG